MKIKQNSKQANTTVKSESCQRIEMFLLNLLHQIGTNVSCMFQRFHLHANCCTTNSTLWDRPVYHSYVQHGCFKKELCFQNTEYGTQSYKKSKDQTGDNIFLLDRTLISYVIFEIKTNLLFCNIDCYLATCSSIFRLRLGLN